MLRGYNKYLDGKFIPDEKGYSHAGIYVGKNMVVHAVSPCVEKCHIIDFCEADRIMVLKPNEGQVMATATAIGKIGMPYDFDYKTDRGLTGDQAIERYKIQLNLYRESVEALLNHKVDSCYLYLLQNGIMAEL